MRFLPVLLAWWSVLALGCDQERQVGDSAECSSLSFRQPTQEAVVCPGAAGCLCAAPQICCVDVQGSTIVGDGTCQELPACRGVALGCDGPEDCPAGLVCCLTAITGGAAECKAASECWDLDQAILCRGDGDCASPAHCTAAAAGSFFDGVAAWCQL